MQLKASKNGENHAFAPAAAALIGVPLELCCSQG